MSHNPISKAKRFRILARDGFKCRYCGAAAPKVELRVDHVISRADGGHSGEENLVTSCLDCNAGKSDRRLTGLAAPIVKVSNRRGRNQSQGDPRNRALEMVRKDKPNHHILNTGAVLEAGDLRGEVQDAYVWCESHQRYEWHRIKQFMVGRSGTLEVTLPESPRQ